MSRPAAGRVVLTLVLVATIAAEIAFTWLGWTGQHIFNPLWHPHARYHAAQMSVCICALSVVAVVVLWRRDLPDRVVAHLVLALQVAWWGGELVALAVPGTSPEPDLAHPNTFSVLGLTVHGNVFFAIAMIVLTRVGAALMSRRGQGSSTSPRPGTEGPGPAVEPRNVPA